MTNYVVEGPKERVETFEATLKRLERMTRPLVENGFGHLWVGNIIHLLGGDWHTIHCRGEITDYHIEDGVLKVSVESAWSELSESRLFLLKHYPVIRIYFQAEEPGMEIYQTNDVSGKYFSEQYIIDSSFGGEEYFEDMSEVADYIQDNTGIETDATEESIRKTAADWVEKNPDNRWLTFHEFEYVSD